MLKNVIYLSDNGKKYVFGPMGNTAFDMDVGTGMPVDLGTSQGFSQVGETVEHMSVSGRPINVVGAVYGSLTERKNSLRNIFAPFSSGRLVFDNKYFIRVYVQDAPSFSTKKNDGKFTMRLFAPIPYFTAVSEQSVMVGSIEPLFTFPVNYATPHTFGAKANTRYANIPNDGDAKVPFGVYLTTTGQSSNITITNLHTFEYLKLNGVLEAGDTVNVYRDSGNVLRAEKTSDGVTTDILSWIDEGSTLFELNVGDNLIAANDDEGGASLEARFVYAPAVWGIYET